MSCGSQKAFLHFSSLASAVLFHPDYATFFSFAAWNLRYGGSLVASHIFPVVRFGAVDPQLHHVPCIFSDSLNCVAQHRFAFCLALSCVAQCTLLLVRLTSDLVECLLRFGGSLCVPYAWYHKIPSTSCIASLDMFVALRM